MRPPASYQEISAPLCWEELHSHYTLPSSETNSQTHLRFTYIIMRVNKDNVILMNYIIDRIFFFFFKRDFILFLL